jgi:hypothetical protein
MRPGMGSTELSAGLERGCYETRKSAEFRDNSTIKTDEKPTYRCQSANIRGSAHGNFRNDL